MSPKRKTFHSHFAPSKQALEVLRKGKILSENETPKHMIERMVNVLIEIEKRFGTDTKEAEVLKNEFGLLLDEEYCVMSTPILTNAGRYLKKPLSACTVPSLDLAHDNLHHIKEVIYKMHQDGMGTGFSLDNLADPVATLRKLNQIAIESFSSGKEDRPVGNMATLSVYHPKIFEFINSKILADKLNENWKFNISVDCDSNFFKQFNVDGVITLQNGKKVKAREIFKAISQAANICADPGLIFIERLEEDNPTPGVGHYVSTAPCAEVGLAKGESCQFGYINLVKFINKSGEIDLKRIKRATHILTRMLDNALEISIDNYSENANKQIMSQKRKIGIGVCGLADLFVQKNIAYDSEEARILALDVITLINFESKIASHELAKIRGSFGAMNFSLKNRHLETPSFLEKKYGNLKTKYVSSNDWKKLAKKVKNTRFLRNASTIALPPTGRSALVIGASTGIEPVFSREDYLMIHPLLEKKHHQFLQTAKNITPRNHLLMASFIQKGVDESISKTINVPSNITSKEIEEIYISAWNLGLKGISIYREGSKNSQPKRL